MPDKEALLAAIDSYENHAIGSGYDDGELSRQRALALDAYQGKIIDAAPEGRSEVTDRAVFETTQWIMPSLMRIYAGGDNIVEFDPEGPEDEDAAAQESDVLNYYVTQKNNWDLIVRTWCQDGLTTKNAYCLAYMEEKLIPEVERYEGQSPEQVKLLTDDDVEVISIEERVDESQQGPLLDPMSGQEIPPEMQEQALQAMQQQGIEPIYAPVIVYDLELRQVKAKNVLRFKVLPPERCKVGEDTPDFTLEDCNYFEYDELVTISDLRRSGFDVDDDLASDDLRSTQEADSRDEEYSIDQDVENPDPSMRQVRVRTIWIRHDYDEDGIAELQRVVRVGEEILSIEPASQIPVACIVPFLNTHRHIGISVADLVFDVQRIKTKMLRSGLDGLEYALNPEKVISEKVNLDDMLISRPGGIKRLTDGGIPGEGHVVPLVTENVFPFAMDGLRHMDTVVESRVGVNKMFQGIDASNVNDHDRVGQLSTMAAQRVEDIARLFGTGFTRLFAIAHELLIKAGGQKQSIQLRGQWVEVNPSQWRTGRDMRIVAPFAAGNKDSLVQRLMIHMEIHEKALAAGLPIVDASDSYELALMVAKATDVPGTKIYTDPRTVPPKEPPPDHTMIALEIENKKADNEAEDESRKAELEAAKITTDADIRRFIAQLQSETQIALAQINNGSKVDLEQFKARLKEAPVELANEAIQATDKAVADLNQQLRSSIEQVSQAIDEMKRASEAPIKVVRKNGKIVGKEVNGKFIALEDSE